MQNRLGSSFTDAEPDPGIAEELALDRYPVGRLFVLFFLMALPLIVVGGRLIVLHVTADERLISDARPAQVTESFESIETTDGRILADGVVLARDVASYQLKMHYRWLEEPADELWLRRKAYERMNKADRRDAARRKLVEEQIERERHLMWSRVARAIGISKKELQERRAAVQQRIERMVSTVELRRDEKERARDDAREKERVEASRGTAIWEQGWQTVRHELTTPPRRGRRDPVVVTEEHDYHIIAGGLELEQIADLVTRPDLYPGIDFQMATSRDYPQRAFATHLVGIRRPTSAMELQAASESTGDVDNSGGVRATDRFGRTGIERSYDEQLRGHRGLRRIVRNADGEIIHREIVRPARAGSDVELSIIEPLQRMSEELLDKAVGTQPLLKLPAGEQSTTIARLEREAVSRPTSPLGACVLAMNVFTGELYVAACTPRFDLNLLVDYDPDLWKHLQGDRRNPQFPRVTHMALPPGSVFKTLTSIAALQQPDFDPDSAFECQGYLDSPDRHRCYMFRHYGYGHGPTNLRDAICRSCNVFFYNTARNIGHRPIIDWAGRLGFGQPTGIDLPGESGGNLPNPDASRDASIQLASFSDSQAKTRKESSRATRWQPGNTLDLAIGQSSLTVTPLQIVRLMALVANGGELVTPRIVRTIRNRTTSEATQPMQPPNQKVDLAPRTLQYLREGLERVVASRRGTGHRHVFLNDVTIAGKTGTAETGGRKGDHAWFAGYVPAEQPQVAFAVVLEHGGSGGKYAGPLAKRLVQEMLELGIIVPVD